ncbi:MAG: GlpM family protein [Candidatus Omnitrophica bacterium]|nr:GlpM family protein [Candidatus Omnitrophota bacterium]
MNISNLIIYFITGGLFTTIIVALEESHQRLLSGLATLIPVFTLVAYFFIGQAKGGKAVGQHAKFVLVGTLISWVPYMLLIAYLSPKIGPNKAIFAGLAAFFVLALIYITAVNRFGFFK